MLPIALAVLVGVVIHVTLHIFRSAAGVKIVKLELLENGTYRESPPPDKLPPGAITVLMPVGDLFFAGAGNLQEHLPSAENVKRAVVILRLRRRKEVGSTFLQLIDRYAQELERNGGKLVLAGVGNHVYQQLEATSLLEKLGEEWVYSATDIVTESLRRAIAEARQWLSEE